MKFGQDHPGNIPGVALGHKLFGAYMSKTHGPPYFAHEALLLLFKNYNSQHSRKFPGPWAGGAYRLIWGLLCAW